jgi:hypothetical protein
MTYRVEVEAAGGFIATFDAEGDKEASDKVWEKIREKYGSAWNHTSIRLKKIDVDAAIRNSTPPWETAL